MSTLQAVLAKLKRLFFNQFLTRNSPYINLYLPLNPLFLEFYEI